MLFLKVVLQHHWLVDSLHRKLIGHENVITACLFTPDGTHIVSGSASGDLRIWDALYGHSKCLFYDPECHDLAIGGMAISPTFGTISLSQHEGKCTILYHLQKVRPKLTMSKIITDE